MIGNDIVDLALAHQESNWQRKGFLDKLFTAHEQQLILSFNNTELMVWNLWSRKEAAYKIYNRMSGQRVFNPIQFECDDDKVLFGDLVYYTQTQITSDYVYTIALTTKNGFNAVHPLETKSNIQKTNGIPNWLNPESNILFPASITHHGRFSRVIILE
ncbi:4'-phosphopantetheinyl transferase family protein [Flavobacterium sp. RSB2_4_14]|uniref:4'-phosphopantetheinyl transferase family protein n=1 Tax=Flavobacterium sp. RSB2_4_14 TaxID=3447665 RepID=UPI003F409B4D